MRKDIYHVDMNGRSSLQLLKRHIYKMVFWWAETNIEYSIRNLVLG